MKLTRLGIDVEEEHVFTAMATVCHLPGRNREDGLRHRRRAITALHQNGIDRR
jgi:hypothetical protein